MFGYIDKEQNTYTFDTLERAIDTKASCNQCSTIMYKPTLDELLVILKG